MKRLWIAALCAMLMALALPALADPVVTDGSYLAYIGEEQHLFLEDAAGGVKTLRTAVSDIYGMRDGMLYCLTAENRIYAIVMDGTGPTTVVAAGTDPATLAAVDPWKLQNVDGRTFLLLTDSAGLERQLGEDVQLTARSRTHLWFVQPDTADPALPWRLSRYALDGSSALPEAAAQLPSLPLSLLATDEAVTAVQADHSIMVYETADSLVAAHSYPAVSQETAAAFVKESKLYRFTADDLGRFTLESVEDIALTAAPGDTARAASATAAPSAPTRVPVTVTAVPAATVRPTARPTATPKPASQTGVTEDGSIDFGARGKTVKKIQARLIELGYPLDAADGVYGENTYVAIRCFQHAIGYRERKLFIKSAQTKLFSADAPAFDACEPLKKGDKGIMVRLLQEALFNLGYDPGKIDASYGDNTVSAVSLFQAAVGLPVTGEADRRTLEVLYGEEVIIAEETPTPGDPAAPFIIRYDPPKPTAKPTKTPKPTAKPTAVPKPTQTPESEASKSDL